MEWRLARLEEEAFQLPVVQLVAISASLQSAQVFQPAGGAAHEARAGVLLPPNK